MKKVDQITVDYASIDTHYYQSSTYHIVVEVIPCTFLSDIEETLYPEDDIVPWGVKIVKEFCGSTEASTANGKFT